MKVMHNPEITARIKVEEYLKKEGEELVNFAYAKTAEDDRRFYVGITYTPRNNNEGDSCPTNRYDANRYDVITYDIETDNFEYCSVCLKYENALIQMGQRIEAYSNT